MFSVANNYHQKWALNNYLGVRLHFVCCWTNLLTWRLQYLPLNSVQSVKDDFSELTFSNLTETLNVYVGIGEGQEIL